LGGPKGKDHWEDLGIAGRITLSKQASKYVSKHLNKLIFLNILSLNGPESLFKITILGKNVYFHKTIFWDFQHIYNLVENYKVGFQDVIIWVAMPCTDSCYPSASIYGVTTQKTMP
jgi:hypothetical protein